jgi:hypothetical protein
MKNLLLLTALFFTFSVKAQIRKPLDNLFNAYQSDIAGKTKEVIQKDSWDNYDRFIAIDVNSEKVTNYYFLDQNKRKTLTKLKAEMVLQAAMNSEVVGLHKYHKYDPDNKGIGFCFGRAMFVNLYLAINGFHRANIKKALVVGPMSKGAWGWHITTIVESRNSNGKEVWLAIDPIVGKVIDVKDWYKMMIKDFSDNGKLKLYIAEAGKFGAGSSRYDEQGISDKFYNNYFTDMMNWFNDNDVSRALKL